MDKDPILAELQQYAERTGLAKSAVGELVANDPNLIFDLERGRELRRATRAKIRAIIEEQAA
ncbi:MAG: hypothetical protein AAFM92_03090 [Pseudomonadota bacterium]